MACGEFAKAVKDGEGGKAGEGGVGYEAEFVRSPYAAWLLPGSPALPSLIWQLAWSITRTVARIVRRRI